jgi:hypothetical protein
MMTILHEYKKTLKLAEVEEPLDLLFYRPTCNFLTFAEVLIQSTLVLWSSCHYFCESQ